MGLWFEIVDFFTTSDVEAMYNQYKNLVQVLKSNLDTAEQYQEKYQQASENLFSTMSPYDSAASGTLQNEYQRAYECFYTNTMQLEQDYSTAMTLLKEKLSQAESQMDYYKGLVDEENAQQRNISL